MTTHDAQTLTMLLTDPDPVAHAMAADIVEEEGRDGSWLRDLRATDLTWLARELCCRTKADLNFSIPTRPVWRVVAGLDLDGFMVIAIVTNEEPGHLRWRYQRHRWKTFKPPSRLSRCFRPPPEHVLAAVLAILRQRLAEAR